MELDPDDVFRDEDEDPENDFFQEKEASKEFVVYLIDASPKMFCSTCPSVSVYMQIIKSSFIFDSLESLPKCFKCFPKCLNLYHTVV
jgi:hypothetical protein